MSKTLFTLNMKRVGTIGLLSLSLLHSCAFGLVSIHKRTTRNKYVLPSDAPKVSIPNTSKELCLDKISGGLYNKCHFLNKTVSDVVIKTFVIGTLFLSPLHNFPQVAFADEYGRETEAPTLYTGETLEICTKRGPLGACLETSIRTAENDNDKATKYFKDPSATLKEKYSATQMQIYDNDETENSMEGNELIKKLKQQSADNKDRNDKIVRQKTLQNDLGASFGPLDRQVVIMNSDGDTYTLLDGAQAMRLKKAGYIKGRAFVTQPTQEVIDEALEAPEGNGLGNFVKGLFSGNDEK